MNRSLRIRLPLLISALIAVSLVAFLSVSFQQVQRELLRVGEAHAQAAADQLATLLAQSAQQRMNDVLRIARDAAIGIYLQQPDDAAAERARQRLSALTAPGQPGIEVWNAAGNRMLVVSRSNSTVAAPLPAVERPTVEGVGAFKASGPAIYWDIVAAVPADGTPDAGARTPIGFIVSRRLLTSASSAEIGRLVGAGAVIKLGNVSGGAWSDMAKSVAAPAVDVKPGPVRGDRGADGQRLAGVAAAVRGAPWLVLVEFPRSAIVAPARAFLLRMLVVAACLVLAAAAAAYVVSARITTPLGALTHAAEAIAQGRFDEPVPAGRRDEIGRLAVAFQAMASDVRSSKQQLETRVEERTRAIAALNRQFEGRVAELKSLTGELEAFSYSVSHDLRAPLRHVVGFAALLEKSASASIDEQGRRYLRTISEAAARMGRLIDDLLEFSRTGRAEMLRARVDLAALVADVRRESYGDRTASEITWIVHSLPIVEGDPVMLRLALINLLSNAVKYSAMRSPARIEIGYTEGPGEIVLFVRDNGVGFDMQYAGKLFGVFQRLHSSDQFEGTGIGLANVRRIVSRHGGRVWAESAPDQGATFFVALPTGVRSAIAATPVPGRDLAPQEPQSQT